MSRAIPSGRSQAENAGSIPVARSIVIPRGTLVLEPRDATPSRADVCQSETVKRGSRSQRSGAGSVVALIVVMMAVSACSSSGSGAPSANGSTTTAPAQHFARTPDGMRAAALAWSKAFLTGSPHDISNMQGPECVPDTTTTFSEKFLEAYLKGERAVMRRRIGVALDAIKNHGVAVRNFTPSRGEAQVLYDLPESATGNDNWVEYSWHDSSWKVSNCNAPIGGSSSSSSTATTPAPHG
jgi:hypothetical protein